VLDMAAQQEPLAQLPPGNLKYLRACLRCRLIKSQKQFEDDGCDNCREMSSRSVSDYTTPVSCRRHSRAPLAADAALAGVSGVSRTRRPQDELGRALPQAAGPLAWLLRARSFGQLGIK
jgi:hypothetical protein